MQPLARPPGGRTRKAFGGIREKLSSEALDSATRNHCLQLYEVLAKLTTNWRQKLNHPSAVYRNYLRSTQVPREKYAQGTASTPNWPIRRKRSVMRRSVMN